MRLRTPDTCNERRHTQQFELFEGSLKVGLQTNNNKLALLLNARWKHWMHWKHEWWDNLAPSMRGLAKFFSKPKICGLVLDIFNQKVSKLTVAGTCFLWLKETDQKWMKIVGLSVIPGFVCFVRCLKKHFSILNPGLFKSGKAKNV